VPHNAIFHFHYGEFEFEFISACTLARSSEVSTSCVTSSNLGRRQAGGVLPSLREKPAHLVVPHGAQASRLSQLLKPLGALGSCLCCQGQSPRPPQELPLGHPPQAPGSSARVTRKPERVVDGVEGELPVS